VEIPFWAQLGVGALAVALLLLGHRRLWVFGWHYAAVEADRDYWRNLAIELLRINDKAVTGTAQAVATAEKAVNA
jgi:hypothetical protein